MRWYKKLKVLRCYLFILGWLGILLICCEVPSEYELVGALIVTRHGDRGPLIEVKNLSSINCGYKNADTPPYKRYITSYLNVSKTNTYINFVGPFMKYPIFPAPSRCTKSHLTPLGVAQHMQLGKVLRSIYIDKLNLLSHPWELDDIIVYSTPLRRTFQSALAFIYSFLPVFDLSNLRLKEAKGINFCGDYCRCDKSAIFDKKHKQEKEQYMKSHPSVVKLISEINPLVKVHEYEDDIVNPYVMRDALLAYACHGAKLPCNYDRCVTFEDISKLLSYEEWEAKQKRTSSQVKSAKLNAFGFLKSIHDSIDQVMGDGRPKVVLYSGHDKSINYLLTSLGVNHFQAPYYASRVVFEIYHNTSSPNVGSNYKKNYHFRLVYNGKDITKQLSFCNNIVVKQVDSGNAKSRAISLCPVLSFDKYLKPSLYFKEFGTSTFTAACVK